MKKTWIKIKRGLLEPKHRDKLGIRIWLYFYILDQADWDTGKIIEWRDGDAADDLQMPKRTLTQQRQQLAEDGYITCEQVGNKQIITIHNYTNPRKYDGEVTNPRGGGARNRVPISMGGNNEGAREGDIEGHSKPRTPSYNPHITNHRSEGEGEPNIFLLCEQALGTITPSWIDELKSLEQDFPAMWITDAFAIAKKNKASNLKYVTAILSRWNKTGKDNGYKKGGKKKDVASANKAIVDKLQKELYGDNA